MRVKYKKLLPALILLGVGGCGVTPLTDEGRMVRQIEPAWANKCRFLGVHDVDAPYKEIPSDRKASFINTARNVSAEAGGDAFVVTSREGGWSTDGQVDVYDCSGEDEQ